MRQHCFWILIMAIASSGFGVLNAQGLDPSDMDPGNAADAFTPYQISEHNIAAGIGVPAGKTWFQPTVWDQYQLSFLPLLPNHEAGVAYDVSETGVAVGESDLLEHMPHMVKVFPHAVKWVNGQPVDLASIMTSGPQDFTMRYAHRINEKGQILGLGRYDKLSKARAFLFEGTVATDLGAINPAGSTEPGDLSEQGVVVGRSSSFYGVNFMHAFKWENNVITDLHDPNVILGHTSAAYGINEWGVIVGSADFIGHPGQVNTATIWENGQITNLGTFGGDGSVAWDINDHGDVVGWASDTSGQMRAFIYKGAKIIDLNTIIPPKTGWTLLNAMGINNRGSIVGEGILFGMITPFILEPKTNGGFEIYGHNSPGSGDYGPWLYGQGYPNTYGGEICLAAVNGLGGAQGLLLLGSGQGVVPFAPGCDIQIMPLFSLMLPIQLKGQGPGAGVWGLKAMLGKSPIGSIYMQILFDDPGAVHGCSVTNPLEMKIM